MWVKICGNTRLEDCLHAADLGADAVGFVFAKGKRTVTAEQVAAITAHLPDALEKVGVFTSNKAEEIGCTAMAARLTGIQLHNDYDPDRVRAIREALPVNRSMRLLQALHWDLDVPAGMQIATFAALVQRVEDDALVDALLIDSRTAQATGGTGHTFDWLAAALVLRTTRLPVIVAGGLNPGNVAKAIHVLEPWGVDVSSGVEDGPGVKNRKAVGQFVQGSRQADRTANISPSKKVQVG